MAYPEEIYQNFNGGSLSNNERESGGAGWGRRHAYNIGRRRAYRLGYEAGKAEQSDPLAGYSNLTEAIKAGDPIDYEKLEGRSAKCVHPELPTPLPIGILQVHNESELRTPVGWRKPIDSFGTVRRYALMHAWWGDYDWTLWVEGEIPLRRKTADQLKVGTYFLGMSPNREEFTVYVGEMEACGQVSIHYTPTMIKSPHKASEWEVLEEYGTFQKPESK